MEIKHMFQWLNFYTVRHMPWDFGCRSWLVTSSWGCLEAAMARGKKRAPPSNNDAGSSCGSHGDSASESADDAADEHFEDDTQGSYGAHANPRPNKI